MSMDLFLSLIIIGALVLTVIITNRNAKADGQANPVNTGPLKTQIEGLDKRMGTMETKMTRMDSDIKDLPTSADIEKLSGEVRLIDHNVANIKQGMQALPTSADLERFGGNLRALDEKLIGVEKLLERTEQATVRIEDKLMAPRISVIQE